MCIDESILIDQGRVAQHVATHKVPHLLVRRVPYCPDREGRLESSHIDHRDHIYIYLSYGDRNSVVVGLVSSSLTRGGVVSALGDSFPARVGVERLPLATSCVLSCVDFCATAPLFRGLGNEHDPNASKRQSNDENL